MCRGALETCAGQVSEFIKTYRVGISEFPSSESEGWQVRGHRVKGRLGARSLGLPMQDLSEQAAQGGTLPACLPAFVRLELLWSVVLASLAYILREVLCQNLLLEPRQGSCLVVLTLQVSSPGDWEYISWKIQSQPWPGFCLTSCHRL